MKMIINILTAIIAFFIFILFVGYFLQRHVIFFPEKLSPAFIYTFQTDFEEKFFIFTGMPVVWKIGEESQMILHLSVMISW